MAINDVHKSHSIGRASRDSTDPLADSHSVNNLGVNTQWSSLPTVNTSFKTTMEHSVYPIVKECTVSAVVTRADGTVEDLGVISELDPNQPGLIELLKSLIAAQTPATE